MILPRIAQVAFADPPDTALGADTSPSNMSGEREDLASQARTQTYGNDNDSSGTQGQGTVSELPPETLDFAAKVFDLARNGDEATLLLYLDRGLPANLTNSKGNTLLMLAAYNGHASLVRLLHSKGADPNRCNDRGQSPLAGAIFKHEEAVVHALVEVGADPRVGTPNAIESAKVFGQEKWLDLLQATEEERKAPLAGIEGGMPTSG